MPRWRPHGPGSTPSPATAASIPSAPSDALLQQYVAGRITVSTVMIGGHVQPTTMIRMAELGKGRFYDVKSAAQLPQIFIKEAAVILKSAIFEETFKPQVVSVTEPIRGIGPALAKFGLPSALLAPRLEVNKGNTIIATNEGWDKGGNTTVIATAAANVGAFALAPGDADTAVLLTLDPGTYTATIRGINGAIGDVLALQAGLGGFFAGYVPGMDPAAYPAGTGKLLKKGSYLVFQMHYTPNGTATEDSTRIGLVYAKAPPKHEVKVAGIVNLRLNIPAGADNHRVIDAPGRLTARHPCGHQTHGSNGAPQHYELANAHSRTVSRGSQNPQKRRYLRTGSISVGRSVSLSIAALAAGGRRLYELRFMIRNAGSLSSGTRKWFLATSASLKVSTAVHCTLAPSISPDWKDS